MEKCPCKKVKCEYHGDCTGCRKHHETKETKWKPACDRLVKKAETRRKKS